MTADPGARRRGWTLAAAVAIVVVAVGVVVVFGIIPYPQLPMLVEDPDPAVTGQLAYVAYDDGGPCLHVVDGRGEDRELGCGSPYEGALEWIEEDRLGVRSYTSSGNQLDVVDTTDGTVVDTADGDPVGAGGLVQQTADGRRVASGREDGRVWVEVSDGRGAPVRVLELDGPDSYELHDIGWTADGQWIATQDSAGRVLVIDPEGAVPARVWTREVGGVAIR